MIRAAEAKQIANAYHNKDMDKLIELEVLVREESAKGKYKLEYSWEEIVKAFGTNNLNQHHQRVLFELTKTGYEIQFDTAQGNLILIWG